MKKLHYFLVCGKIVFQTNEGESGEVTLNAMVTHDNRNVPARLIGKAQQALQMHFFKQIEDPTVKVLDVPILTFTHLGLMTEKEFHAAPDGMKLAEKVVDPFADSDKPTTVTDLSQVN